MENVPPWYSSGLQLAVARAFGEILHLRRNLRQAFVLGAADDRRDQPALDRHGDRDIDR